MLFRQIKMLDKKTSLSEDKPGVLVQSPWGRLNLQYRHGGGLCSVDGKPDVVVGDAVQRVGHAHRVYGADFFDVVGNSGSWCGADRNVTRRRGARLELSVGYVYVGRGAFWYRP